MERIDEWLRDYEVDVDFPDVSGFEIIETLMTRSEIAALEPQLTQAQRLRLEAADRKLMRDANRFYQSLREIADLPTLRANSNVLPSHWWWYLDALVEEPAVAA